MKKIFLLIAFLLTNCIPANAQSYYLNGNAYSTGSNCFVLTNEGKNLKGSVWFAQKLDLRNAFDIEFTMNFGRLDAGGADGMGFVLQSVGTTAIGTTGGSFAYVGVTPSFAVEFDTYQNGSVGDPAYDHVAFVSNGVVDHSGVTNLAGPVAAKSSQANIEDSVDHKVRLIWNPTNDSIKLYFDCELRLASKINIISTVFSGNPSVWWGFSGSTGGSMNKQGVCVTNSVLNSLKDTTICLGDTVQLNAPVGNNYSWYPSTGVSNTGIASPLFNPIATTKYYVNYTDDCNEVHKDSATVTLSTVNVSLGPDTNLCHGKTISLNAGSGFSGYLWQSGATTQTLTAGASGTYWVRATNSRGCKGIDTAIVAVMPALSLSTLPLSPTVCIGDLVNISASGASSYSWSPATSLSSASGSSINAFPTTSSNYKLFGTNASGCTDSLAFSVTVNSLPDVSLTPNSSICTGSSIQLTASGGTGYSWLPSGNLSDPAISNPVATPGTTTTYTLIVTNANGCSKSASMTVTVNSTLVVSTSPNIAICSGFNTQLTSTGGASFSWIPSAGLSNPNISNPIADPSVTTNYTVISTDAGSCSGSASVTVSVNPLPAVVVSSGTSICQGENTQLSSSGGISYTWSPSSGLNNSGISNPLATPTSSTTYTVTATDANGCKNTGSTTINVNPLPTVSVNGPASICAGASVQLSASGGTGYIWSPSGSLSNGNIFNPVATPASTSAYSVTITDANGCSKNATTSVTVNPLPVVSASSSRTICLGSPAQLTSSGGTSFTWSPASGLSNPNISNPIANPSSAVTYTVTATDNNGCSGNATVNVAVNPLPVVNASPDVAICLGANIQITATGGASYTWSSPGSLNNPGIFNPVASPAITTTFTVTATDINGCTNKATTRVTINALPVISISMNASVCTNSSAQLSASGGTSYTWTPSGGLSNPNIANPAALPSSTTTYTVLVTNANNCSSTATTMITVNATLVVSASPNTAICLSAATQLTSAGGISFTWSPAAGLSNPNISNPTANPTTATTYTVTSSDINGCSGSSSVTVSVNPLPLASLSANSSICTGSNTQLTASGGSLYTWSPFAGLSNAFISNPVASPTATTNYSLSLTDSNGCSATGAVTITVNPLPIVSVSPGTSVCVGSTAQLSASGGATFSWLPGSSLNNSGISNPVAGPTSSTTYTVTVTDINGCANANSTAVTVNALPVVSVSPDTTICSGFNAQLTSSGGGQFSWTPSTGLNNPNVSNPFANPTTTTFYTVNVTDANGCSASSATTVTINPAPSLIPSVSNLTCFGTNDGTASVSVTGSSPFTYLWNTGATTQNISSLNAGTYSVAVTDMYGCVFNRILTVTEPPQIVLNFKRDYYVCNEAGGVMLEASGGTTYLWTPGADLDDSTSATPFTNPFMTTTYIVTVSNGSCYDTAHVTVHLITPPPLPSITQNGDTLSVPAGYARYQWYYNGSPVLGATNNVYGTTMDGLYSVFLSDSFGCKGLTTSVYVITTGLSSPVEFSAIKIFPNPTHGLLSITSTAMLLNNEDKTTVKLFNTVGEVVYSHDFAAHSSQSVITIDIASLASGLYFIQMSTQNSVLLRERIVKE